MKLQFVSNQGNKLGIGGFPLGIAHGIAKEPLEGIEIPSVPGDLNGMADGPLHSGRSGLECFRHLGVQYLGDGIGVPYGPPGGLAGCSRTILRIQRLNVADLLLSLSSRSLLLYGFENMIAKNNRQIKRETYKHLRKFYAELKQLILTKT